jgi:diadenosine tetraphosphate (Ap4A) HIT family hydrolase
MDNCLICANAPEALLAENQHAKLLLFHAPQVPGHVIVAAKEHVRLYHELSDETIVAIARLTSSATLKVKTALGCDRYYLASIGDRDFHFHFHILPHNDSNPPLGPFVFGERGWSSTRAGEDMDLAATKLRRIYERE